MTNLLHFFSWKQPLWSRQNPVQQKYIMKEGYIFSYVYEYKCLKCCVVVWKWKTRNQKQVIFNYSHLFNYFVTFPVNFPFSRLKSCFSTLIELENETWVTDFCSRPKGVDKRVTKVSFSNEIRVEKQDWKLEKEGKFTGNGTK